ncbi:hypothetical protein LTR10_015097 [Elasticomyces elasticus]|uniref:Nucleoporin Nup82 n=1 Tax=Exophiala sideris TaxID=1016849 RepID=A0ABR0JQW2_9EURO|nr:hypothetical protein LTR10_015097 [Elasticomyces elasticus]KAK5034705.1 hypothetical protein LTR13_006361 [Exophiala sideris]KAK5039972.1 hypothetical protein LTS07_000467 [Exophiala sideris]KAK5068351.1 hypothetical protein LTR69_000469 [Exophiala sideris]KAK5187652.1 hypothetical protein LTR44_000468 [Eurotiomycetes sp. CCFEE 6388]
MPKVIGHTPPWLSRPSAGARIFTDPTPQSPESPSKRASYLSAPPSADYQGPRRLVASRGTEIFTVVGNKIRWADLSSVRDDWEESSHSGNSRHGLSQSGGDDAGEPQAYRTLDVSIYYQIRQIVISPSGLFLAISTEHTVHIAVLPPTSRLTEHDRSPLKLKTYQLGPTIHVIPESPLASVLWHPLAASTVSSDCIVTITAEAAVRVWELDRSNKWSFERPALSIDLRKLADGVSCDEDFEPSGFGKTRGFSVDDFDMEVSAASFGGHGRDDEDAWASMTLWTAMRNGDIYALCPLLPSRWKPTSTTIPSLSTNAVSRMASIAGEDVDVDERRAADQQYEWVQEIDNDDPVLLDSVDSLEPFEVRLRPQNPSAIPRLQGPFSIQSEDEASDIEISDIFVFAATIDEHDLMMEEDDDDFDQFASHGIPFTTICVATTTNEALFAIDLDGVSGQWLPKKGKSAFSVPTSDAKGLILIDTITVETSGSNAANNWPMFTSDAVHNFNLFLTASKQIYSFSLNEWIMHLADELTGTEPLDPGFKTRLETTCESQVCITNKLLQVDEPTDILSAPAIVDDVSLGSFILSTAKSSAYVVFFDQAHLQASMIEPSSPELTAASPSRLNSQHLKVAEQEDPNELENLPTRAPYVPNKVFYANPLNPAEQMKQRLPPNLKRAIVEKPMRLSPGVLEIMTVTHRTISAQSGELEKAAAELFRRCERLREELGNQVKQMSELAQRLQHLKSGGEEDEDGNVADKKSAETRIQNAKERQASLMTRYEALRRKVGRVGSAKRELSTKETAWVEEIDTLGRNVGIGDDTQESGDLASRLDKRFEEVKRIAQELLDESKRVTQDSAPSPMSASMSTSMSTTKSAGSGSTAFGVSSRLQKERIGDVMAMVERESAVIDAVMKRLERLKVEY